MSIEVRTFSRFNKELKRLGKKFRSLFNEIDELVDRLEVEPTLGKSMGVGLHKIRLASQSKATQRVSGVAFGW